MNVKNPLPGNPYNQTEPVWDESSVAMALRANTFEQRTANMIAAAKMYTDTGKHPYRASILMDLVAGRLGFDQPSQTTTSDAVDEKKD